jgi:solute carrier family 13 (sodium-dependent dicarboxylate transporter), member 2/3/5
MNAMRLQPALSTVETTRASRCTDYAEYITVARGDRWPRVVGNRIVRALAATRVRWALAMSIAMVCGVTWFPALSAAAQFTLMTFGFAIIGWTVLDLDETPVAIGAALALVAFGVATTDMFYDALGSELIWLMIGGFVLAAAVTQSGLAERFGEQLMRGAANIDRLFLRITLFIVGTAFVIPSTSARAALLLPVFLGLAAAIGQPRVTRALALLFPTIILLSACASLLGAGAHLVAIDFMTRVSGNAPGFVEWIVLAAPFALVSSLIAMKCVAWMFLTRAERMARLSWNASPNPEAPMTLAQQRLIAIVGTTIVAWALTDLHRVDAAIVALIGALAATTKALTGIDIKTAIKKVEWNLVLFLAATMVLGEALHRTGAGHSIAQAMLSLFPIDRFSSEALLILCGTVALLSHLLITSRTVRATVLIPTIALPLAMNGVDASLMIFVAVIGSGFCQTFTVSAKPVAVFAQSEASGITARNLTSLSAVLFAPLLALLACFALFVWPTLGLQ